MPEGDLEYNAQGWTGKKGGNREIVVWKKYRYSTLPSFGRGEFFTGEEIMSYPLKDNQYEEVKIKEVSAEKNGWSIKREDGWSFFVKKDSQIVPEVGMTARFYGEGIGRPVRGLFLDGIEVFYDTADDYSRKSKIELYGENAEDWLKRWDSGKTVWSIEMGGLGPGYEQCIHITCAEILRHLLAEKYDVTRWDDKENWKTDREKIEQYGFKNKTINDLGLSGAQWGAALNLAGMLYRHGPVAVMTDERAKDRHIQVSKNYPKAE